VAAVSVGILEAGEAAASRQGLILDLEYEEDHRAAVDCNLVAARRFPGSAAPAGDGLELVEFQATGEGRSYTRAEAADLMDLGLDGCARLMAAQSAALA
jgi:ribonuclease PH